MFEFFAGLSLFALLAILILPIIFIVWSFVLWFRLLTRNNLVTPFKNLDNSVGFPLEAILWLVFILVAFGLGSIIFVIYYIVAVKEEPKEVV